MSGGTGESPSILIIGSGFGGLCLAIYLVRAGIRTFTILEKGEDVGGTWRDNTYPGAACDVPSIQYCYSFARKTDWSRKWAPQEEILEYIRDCVKKYDLERHIRFGAEVESARYDEDHAEWTVRTRAGEEHRARFLVSAVGQLNRPSIPKISGLESFGGKWFHSARFPKGESLAGRNVAVVGNAASAVQLVPELAKVAGRLTVFQRSANWILPKGDRAYTDREKAWFARFPLLALLYRFWLWYTMEARFPLLRGNVLAAWIATRVARNHLETQVKDPVKRRALVPDYPIGAKRVLITDDYYPALERENVELVTERIDRFTERGILTRDGVEHVADTVVFATGFDTTAFLAPMHLTGRNGRTLDEAWSEGARAYLGLTVPGFPNFFMMYGPNTNLGHNSIIFMLECQARYVLGCLRQMMTRKIREIDLLPEVLRDYDAFVQERLSETVWARVDESWYKTASGRITNNWYGPTWKYWLATRKPALSSYLVRPESAFPGARAP